MRLLEFLNHKSLDNKNEWHRRIPLYYLGGSYSDYAGFRTSKILESILNEAAIDRYLPMIKVFEQIDQMGIGDDLYTSAKARLDWAMSVLKRDDRIVWYMRIVKFSLLQRAMNTISVIQFTLPADHMSLVTKEYNKANGKLSKIYQPDLVKTVAYRADRGTFTHPMEHFLSMGIPKIDQTVWKDQTPWDIEIHFANIEQEWVAARKSVVDTSQDDDWSNAEVILQFPDGSAWFNLNRSSCEIEGDAMGHCGNSHVHRDEETVLSYRVPVDPRGGAAKTGKHDGVHWKPRLTFIYNTTTGMLGEMKGRANNKPKAELHPKIIALLKMDMIKGINGGGYAPDQNFSMYDLPEDTREALIAEKPSLGTLSDHYKLTGWTPEIASRFTGQLDAYGVEHHGITSNDKGPQLIAMWNNNVKEFINDQLPSGSYANTVSEYVMGEDQLDYEGGYSTLDDRQTIANEVFDKDPAMWESLQAYVSSEYAEDVGYDKKTTDYDDESEYDIDDVNDVVRLLDDNGDDIYNQIGWAIDDGHSVGAESQMYNAFWQWLREDIFEEAAVNVNLSDSRYDGPVEVWVDIGKFFKSMEYHEREYDGESLIDSISGTGWIDWMEFSDLEQPYYGWDDYDESAAIESFSNIVEIPEVAAYEIEHEGAATKEDAKNFVKWLSDEFEGATAKSMRVVLQNDGGILSDIEEMNGNIVMNYWGISGGDTVTKKATFARTLRKLTEFAKAKKLPIVIRQYDSTNLSNMVSDAGYKKVKHDYLKFDPSVTEAIKLRGFSGGENAVADFLDDLRAHTSPHPMNHTVLYGSVGLDVSKWGDGVHLGDIVNYGEAGKGHGTEALRLLTQLADKHGVTITGVAKAYSDKAGHIQDTNRLAQWYEKNGFTTDEGFDDYGFDIEYKPTGE